MPNHSNFRLRGIACYIALAISGGSVNAWADDSIQFDPRFLELKGDTKIDLGKFSKKGYVDAGKYNLRVFINKQSLSDEYDINWYVSENDPTKTYACLTPELVAALGLKEGIAKSLQWTHNDECLKPGQLDGMEVENDLSQSALLLTVPQAYLEYTSSDWDPPSRWDDGISGLIADYSLNAQTRHQEQGGEDSHDISGNGTVGANLGAWRFRADWQSDYQHTRSNDDEDDSSNSTTSKNWDWSRYYAWRALPSLKAKLSLGEDYLNSDIFDGFNYIGSSVSTDDQMLPPNLRGYAPDVSGVAHSSAKVTISQMGRVLYETQVPAGPFRIQDIGDSVSGTLHVRVEEQNGQVQEYDVTTASMPFLTRQGQVRYKVMMGRPEDWNHKTEGGFFSGNNVIVIEAGVGNTARRRKLFTVTVKDPRKVVVSGNVHIRTRVVFTVLVFIRVQFGHIRFVKRNGCITTDKVGTGVFLEDGNFQVLVNNRTRIDIIRIAAATAGRRNIQQSQRSSLEGITGLSDRLDFNTDIASTIAIGDFITGFSCRRSQLRFTATRIITVAVPFDGRRRFRINACGTIIDIPFGIADIPTQRDGIP